LLNLEYFIDEPWLGGDQWQPEGFVVRNHDLPATYALEIAPVQDREVLRVQINYGDSAAQIANTIANNLAQEVEAVLDYCERYANSKARWLGELGTAAPDSSAVNSSVNVHRERGSIACAVDEDILSAIAAECEVDNSNVLLAAYAVLLSRLNGREKILLAASLSDDFVPLRLNPAWKLTFKQFVEAVRRKIALSSRDTLAQFDVIAQDIFGADQNALSAALGFGYVFRKSEDAI